MSTTVLDDKTQKAVEDIYNGTLAQRINNNMKYSLTGILIGAIIGIGVATLMGKSRMTFGLGGALIGGGLGYLTAKDI